MEQIVTKNEKKFRFLSTIIAVLIFIFMVPSLSIALTPSGTVIGNQATATYTDTIGNAFTAQSNLFTITVSQVAGLSLTPASQSRSGAPANEVQFPHTVKNPGNGTDTYNLTAVAGGTVTLNTITIIRDDNGDGTANPGEPAITSVTLNMDESQMIVVRATVPSSAVSGTNGTITLNATSTLTASVTQQATDTANIVTVAIISMAKSVSALKVNPSGTLDYTINYTNVGVASTVAIGVTIDGASANRHVVRDMISATTTFVSAASFLGVPTPAGGEKVYHVATSSLHAYVTTQPAAGTFDAVAYLFTTPLTGGQSGAFSFRVTVNANAPVTNITNQSVMYFNDGSATTSQNSNTTSSTVNLIPAVVIRDTDGGAVDIQDSPTPAPAGSTVVFENQVVNTSNGTDRYNVTAANVNYPDGTTFSFFNSDGITPLLDTNADGIPDTGAVTGTTTASSTLMIKMKAVIPANATNTGAPFDVTVTVRSVANSTIIDTVTNRLSSITGPSVDLTNTFASPLSGAAGFGAGPETPPVVTVTGDPLATVSVRLFVNNTGPSPDSFDLQFAKVGTPFGAGILPDNIASILFFAGNGSGVATGSPLTSTGQIAIGGNKEIIARVTVSPNVAGETIIPLFFKAVSVASGVSDIIRDQLTVNVVRSISLLQDQNGQASAGSATTYSHVLKNTGNVTEPQINLAATNTQPGFLTTIYRDFNGDGFINAIGGTDAVITNVINLGAASSTSLIIRVSAPSSAANGAVDTMTLTATPTGTVGTVGAPAAKINKDQTTVVTGQIEMTLAASPSGSQLPGTVITYTISYQNVGAASVNALLITDAIPVNTTYVAGSMRRDVTTVLTDSTTDGDGGESLSGLKGSVRFNIGTVGSGASGTVSFQVTID